MGNSEALEYLHAAMFEQVSPSRMERTIASGRDTFHLAVTGDAWTDLVSTQGFVIIADTVADGGRQILELRSRDVRDLLALYVHLSYMASFRNTAMSGEMVRALQTGFESRGTRVVMPFLQEDECSWIGRITNDRIVLANPVVHYGHAYVEWREKVCEPYDRVVLPVSPGGLLMTA